MIIGIGVLDKTSGELQLHENRLIDGHTLLVDVPKFTPYFHYRLTDLVKIRHGIVSCDAA